MRLVCVIMAMWLSGCAQRPSTTPLRIDGHSVATLHTSPDHQPCLWPVKTPGGIAVTRAFPFQEDVPGEQHDHPHHRGVWCAHGDVNGHDAWHGDVTISTQSVHAQDGAIRSVHVWIAADGTELLRDTRRWRAHRRDAATVIDVDVMLEAIDAPMAMGDTKEGTMAIRLHPQLRVDGPVANGTLLTSAGIEGKPVWGTRARWCAAQGTVDGAPVTVALVDHPENVNHPTWWHARTYGLLAANPFGRRAFEGGDVAPMQVVIEPGRPLRLRYRLIAADGTLSPDAIERCAGVTPHH